MTRMWMCNPRILCRKHLLGEHNEIHKLVGSIKKKHSITGYIDKNCVEPMSIAHRHFELLYEMKNRGYNHNSPLPDIYLDISYIPVSERTYFIDREESLKELLNRCPDCAKRFNELQIKEEHATYCLDEPVEDCRIHGPMLELI